MSQLKSFRRTFDGKLSFEDVKSEIEKLQYVNPHTHIWDATHERETTTGDNIFNLIRRKFGEDDNEVTCIKWGGSWYCMGVNLKYPS